VERAARRTAPSVNIFGIFEGETTGKAQTHSWLRSHGFDEYSLAEYSPDELRLQLRSPQPLTPDLTLTPPLCNPNPLALTLTLTLSL
jgi:hypothetical protein